MWLFWKQKGFWQQAGVLCYPSPPRGAPANSPGITNCPGLILFNTLWSLPSLTMSFKSWLLGLVGRKASLMVGTAGITILFHGLGADGAPKPVRSLEICSPDGVGWELSLLSAKCRRLERNLKGSWHLSVCYFSFIYSLVIISHHS